MRKKILTSAIEHVLTQQHLEHQQALHMENIRRMAEERAAKRLQQAGGKLNYTAVPYKPAAEAIYAGDPELLTQVNDIISSNMVAAALAQ